jgi:hypothetical protein
MNNYICHSGGCPGADMEWENQGLQYGIKTIAYSFYNHFQEGKNQKILTVDELKEGWENVLIANETLKRYPQGQSQYVKNLLSRNWFQVKNSDAIFAIAKSVKGTVVEGGTGWAVQMAIDCDKPVFVFLQGSIGGSWFRYMPIVGFECLWGEIPKLPQNFAGIGTRELQDSGKEAIKRILEFNFKK